MGIGNVHVYVDAMNEWKKGADVVCTHGVGTMKHVPCSRTVFR